MLASVTPQRNQSTVMYSLSPSTRWPSGISLAGTRRAEPWTRLERSVTRASVSNWAVSSLDLRAMVLPLLVVTWMRAWKGSLTSMSTSSCGTVSENENSM